jgi:hypothetical protein
VLTRLAALVLAAMVGVWVWMIPVEGYTECDRSDCGSGYTALLYALYALVALLGLIVAVGVGRFLLVRRHGRG